MICKIADLNVKFLEVGSLAPHLWDYQAEDNLIPDIIIDPKKYNPNLYTSNITLSISTYNDLLEYMESGRQFHAGLLKHDGFFLHASAVEYEGKAYLFSGKSGTGKSTHTQLWKKYFGDSVQIFNDDKPSLRRLENNWYAYGSPWCGKDHININVKVPLAGICFLKQAPENRIRRLFNQEAINKILAQTIRIFYSGERLDLLLRHLDKLVREVPVFELENRPVPEAAKLSYETMRKAAEEMGL